MPTLRSGRRKFGLVFLGLFLGGMAPAIPGTAAFQPILAVTNILHSPTVASLEAPANCRIRLEGNVWWVNPAEGRLILQDHGNMAELETDLKGQPVSAGQRVRLTGNGTITTVGAGFRIGVIGPVVDNNGVRQMIENQVRFI